MLEKACAKLSFFFFVDSSSDPIIFFGLTLIVSTCELIAKTFPVES